MTQRIPLEGSVIGRLSVHEYIPKLKRYRCTCSCGEDTLVLSSHLGSGHTMSCGCLKKDTATNLKHGACKTHELYYIWAALRQRCTNPRNKSYLRYGGRGISVDPRWDDFMVFVSDMGPRPKGYTIDRIDNNGNYEPSNCRWTDRGTQSNNSTTRKEFDGKSRTEWAKELGVSIPTIVTRIKRHGSPYGKAPPLTNREHQA